MKSIQEFLLEFLNDESNSGADLQFLTSKFQDLKFYESHYELESLLHLLVRIANNHHCSSNFYGKIEAILTFYKDDIQKFFSNSQIFNIFVSNKRILLYLIEEKIITIDEYIVKKLTSDKYVKMKYPQYFSPEIRPFMNEKWFPKIEVKKENNSRNNWNNLNNQDQNNLSNKWIEELKNELPEKFYEKRKNGQNDSYICELIEKDLVEEFIAYVNKINLSPRSTIDFSNYETNSFLIKKFTQFKNQESNKRFNPFFNNNQNNKKERISLIEYAAFFGSIQIFNYLRMNNVDLLPSLWMFAIHGNNAELIHLLEELNVKFGNNECYMYIIESIKCHHNDLANYFINNYMQNAEDKEQSIFIQALKYYNFNFIQNKFIKKSFYHLCEYDYCPLVEILLKDENTNINEIVIFKKKNIYKIFN